MKRSLRKLYLTRETLFHLDGKFKQAVGGVTASCAQATTCNPCNTTTGGTAACSLTTCTTHQVTGCPAQ